MTAEKEHLTVFYDGDCYLCSTEICHYQKKDKENKLAYVNIVDKSFSAQKYGVDDKKVQQEMHVQLPNGELKVGVDAFIEIWKTIPGFSFMARFTQLPGVYRLACWAYAVFAKIRPFLPRRKASN